MELSADPAELRYELARRGSALMQQQCWCWGQDVRRPDGNLLLEYGFERHRPPDGSAGATLYFRVFDGGVAISLWGWGYLYSDPRFPEAIFHGRFDFTPRACAQAGPAIGVHSLDGLTFTPTAPSIPRVTASLQPPAIRWIAEYERWVIAHAGLDYRERSAHSFPGEEIPGAVMAAEWYQLANIATEIAQPRLPGHSAGR